MVSVDFVLYKLYLNNFFETEFLCVDQAVLELREFPHHCLPIAGIKGMYHLHLANDSLNSLILTPFLHAHYSHFGSTFHKLLA